MSMWDYINDLPQLQHVELNNIVTLGEGHTPLVPSPNLGPSVGLRQLFFKLESANPTGSYKDRFAAAAVADMRQRGQSLCLATSSGNTGAALAAYCAAASMKCKIAVVENAPQGKVRQMRAYGAELYTVREFGPNSTVNQQVMEGLAGLVRQGRGALQISAFCYSPIGMHGVQTIAYELAAQRPQGIQHVFCSAGGGGLTLAIARGFEQLGTSGKLTRGPAVECVQPQGNNTIAGPLAQGQDRAQSVSCTTSISGLQVANVLDGNQTISACRASGGSGHLVSDETVYEVQQRLAREDGIFCEPAAAVTVAGALQAWREGRIAEDATVVCLITGTGFKDEKALQRLGDGPLPCLNSAAEVPDFVAGSGT